MKEMSYEKCYNCSHSITQYFNGGGGILITCKITGDSLAIQHCIKEESANEGVE